MGEKVKLRFGLSVVIATTDCACLNKMRQTQRTLLAHAGI
ncbi:MAG: hypothetical protein ACI9KA_001060 [Parasphingorhabdus sp.]|jgi:hypothetical protein